MTSFQRALSVIKAASDQAFDESDVEETEEQLDAGYAATALQALYEEIEQLEKVFVLVGELRERGLHLLLNDCVTNWGATFYPAERYEAFIAAATLEWWSWDERPLRAILLAAERAKKEMES